MLHITHTWCRLRCVRCSLRYPHWTRRGIFLPQTRSVRLNMCENLKTQARGSSWALQLASHKSSVGPPALIILDKEPQREPVLRGTFPMRTFPDQSWGRFVQFFLIPHPPLDWSQHLQQSYYLYIWLPLVESKLSKNKGPYLHSQYPQYLTKYLMCSR